MKKICWLTIIVFILCNASVAVVLASDKVLEDSFETAVYFDDFNSYSEGELFASEIKSMPAYEKIYNNMAWSARNVHPPVLVDDGENGKCIRIATQGTVGAIDNYFRTRSALINNESEHSMPNFEVLSKVKIVKFKIDFRTDVLTNASITAVVHRSAEGENKKIYMDFAGFNENGKVVLKDGTQIDYLTDKTYSFEIFANFESDTYSIYTNGELWGTNIRMNTESENAYALTFGIRLDDTSADGYVYVDNVGYFTAAPVAFVESVPENGSEKVAVLGRSIEFKFNTYFSDIPKGCVSILPNIDFDVKTDKNALHIYPKNALSFDTVYKVSLSGNICDAAGRTVNIEQTISFTTVKPEIFATDIEFGGSIGKTVTAAATIVNPLEKNNVRLVLAAYAADSKMICMEEKTFCSEKGSTPVSVGLDTSNPEISFARAFVTVDNKPLSNKLYQLGGELISPVLNDEETTVEFSQENICFADKKINISCKSTSTGVRAVVLSLCFKENKLLLIPLYTDAEGKLSYSLPISDDDGKYTVAIYGKYLKDACFANKYYLKNTTKEALTIKLNKNAATVSDFIEENKQMLNLNDASITETSLMVLSEQLPVDSVDKVKGILENVITTETELQSVSWDKLDRLYAENKTVIFGDSLDVYEKYQKLATAEKNRFNVELVTKDLSSLTAFRNAFLALTQSYAHGGGSGGGGEGKTGTVTGTATKAIYNVDGVINRNIPFPDIFAAPWVTDAAAALKAAGTLDGDENGNLRPNDKITRSEFVKLIVKACGIAVGGKASFKDALPTAWYSPYLAAAEKSGIIKGDENGYFGIGDYINRQDMAVMVFRAICLSNQLQAGDGVEQISDESEISDYAKEAVKALYEKKIINGMGDGSFKPKENSTRAQAVKMVFEATELLKGAA